MDNFIPINIQDLTSATRINEKDFLPIAQGAKDLNKVQLRELAYFFGLKNNFKYGNVNIAPEGQSFVFASEGTYPLWGNITVPEDSVYILIYDGSVFSYVELPIPSININIVDTISDLRNTEGTEGQVITLLGYYEAGDKEPLNYKWTSEQGVDDGGAVINTESGSWIAVFGTRINVLDFGCIGNGVFDNTVNYENIIRYAPENHIIEFEPNKKYVGFFDSYKSLTILANKSILMNGVSSSPIMRFRGDIYSSYCEVIYTVGYGDVDIYVSNTDDINEGDIITISDNKKRPSDNEKVNFETLRVKSVDRVNNILSVFDMVRSSQTQFPITVDLIKPIKGIKLFDAVFESNETHNSHQITFDGCDDMCIESIETFNNPNRAINIRNSINFNINDVNCNPPRLNGGGQGYGVALSYCREGFINRVVGYQMRHLIDYNSCYDIELTKVRDHNPFSPIQMCHNTFGGKLTVRDVIVDGSGYAALHVQGQGVLNANSHILRDCIIEDVTHVCTELVGNIRSVRIESSVNNLQIDNIRTINKIPDFSKTTLDCIVSLGTCSINGNVSITNLYSNLIGVAVLHSRGDEQIVSNLGTLEIDGVKVDDCLRGFTFLGTIRVRVDNVYFLNAISTSSYLMSISPTALGFCDLGNNIRIDNSISIFDQDSNVLLMGRKANIQSLDTTIQTIYTIDTFSRSNLDNRSILKLEHNFPGNLIMKSATVFPKPQFINEEFFISLNTPSDFGIKGSVVISSANTNIINPDGGYGLTIRSGETVRFIASYVGADKSWVVERLNRNASINVKGVVNQSESVSNLTTADATDLATALILVNELKTKLNAKLTADRNSGQQATT